ASSAGMRKSSPVTPMPPAYGKAYSHGAGLPASSRPPWTVPSPSSTACSIWMSLPSPRAFGRGPPALGARGRGRDHVGDRRGARRAPARAARYSLRLGDGRSGAVAAVGRCGEGRSDFPFARLHEAAVDEPRWLLAEDPHDLARRHRLRAVDQYRPI